MIKECLKCLKNAAVIHSATMTKARYFTASCLLEFQLSSNKAFVLCINNMAHFLPHRIAIVVETTISPACMTDDISFTAAN